jgi:hypothetical protein
MRATHIGLAATPVILALALSACAGGAPGPASTRPAPDGPGEARWVESTPGTRTLLVSPDRVARVSDPGESSADLAIGAFFARYTSEAGPLDQLALMVVLEGEEATRLLDSGLQLVLQIDGEYFIGEPGLGSNSVHWDPRNGGRATLAIPISPEILAQLCGAERVHGRIGAFASFDFPAAKRARLGDLLPEIPADYQPSVSVALARKGLVSM